jgi:hypothetical protein
MLPKKNKKVLLPAGVSKTATHTLQAHEMSPEIKRPTILVGFKTVLLSYFFAPVSLDF